MGEYFFPPRKLKDGEQEKERLAVHNLIDEAVKGRKIYTIPLLTLPDSSMYRKMRVSLSLAV